MEGNLSAQWSLSSAASLHCMTLGYHRNSTMEHLSPGDALARRRLFWYIYNTHYSLVLTLGRAPVIQDYDIEISRNHRSSDPKKVPWEASTEVFSRFVTIQAQVYKRLYSPAATKLDAQTRESAVRELMHQLEQWMHIWKAIDFSNAYHSEAFLSTFLPLEVTYYSVVTLVLRGATDSSATEDISPACFNAANQGLKCHLAKYAQIRSKGHDIVYMYAVW